MNIIKQGHYIIDPISKDGEWELHKIERIARVSYQSHDKTGTIETTRRFIRSLIERGHESVLEHVSLSVKFTTDRGVTHELVRHRLASFTQESTRYCNYANDKFGHQLTFVEPVDLEPGTPAYDIWKESCLCAEFMYFGMIEKGASAQLARSVLPTSIKADIVVTANLREWRHILKLRTAKDAHPQMRALMLPLLDELKENLPVIFDDIGVEV